MTAILLDTHAWAWSFAAVGRLSKSALAAFADADTIVVSPVSFFEIAQKVRLGKWPEMEPYCKRLPAMLEEQRGSQATLDGSLCVMAGSMTWSHRDPFDRLLAATALHYKLPLLSADTIFDGVVTRLW